MERVKLPSSAVVECFVSCAVGGGEQPKHYCLQQLSPIRPSSLVKECWVVGRFSWQRSFMGGWIMWAVVSSSRGAAVPCC